MPFYLREASFSYTSCSSRGQITSIVSCYSFVSYRFHIPSSSRQGFSDGRRILTRSLSSTTHSKIFSGRAMERSKILGLVWFPISRRSLNPAVITIAVRAPFRSKRAFVATVVPIRIWFMDFVGILDSRGIAIFKQFSKILRMPSRGPSPYYLSSERSFETNQ